MITWGTPPSSSLDMDDKGQCVDFLFTNTLTDTVDYAPLVHEAGTAHVNFKFYSEPELFSVEPNVGWQVVTDNLIVVPEWTTGIITVCQMLLG